MARDLNFKVDDIIVMHDLDDIIMARELNLETR